MITPEDIRFIKEEISRQLNVVLWGQKQTQSDEDSEDIGNLFGSMPTMTKRPLVESYGFHSRAPQNTTQCVVRTGEHPGSRAVIGHLDGKRPALTEGETILYNQYGQQVYLKNGEIQLLRGGGKIKIGSDSSDEPLVLGNVFKSMMDTLLTLLSTHTHVTGIPGAPTSSPIEASQFTQIKTSPIDDKAILSDSNFTEK